MGSTDWSYQQSNSNVGPGLYDAMHGRHIKTQLIIMNADLNYNLGRDRLATVNDPDIPDNKKFSKTLGSGSGDPFDLLLENQPAFYFDAQKHAMATSVYVEDKVRLVQSLCGMEIPHEVTTDEQLEDMFVYAGLPLYKGYVNRSGELQAGVAVAVAGSLDVWNYGHDTWMPGDHICWRAPHVDEKAREEERATLPFDRENPAARDRMIMEVLTFEKAHFFLQKTFTKSFSDEPNSVHARKYSWQRLIPGADDAVTQIESGVISTRTIVQSAALNTIIWLRLTNILPAPNGQAPNIGRTLSPADYNSDDQMEIEGKTITDILEGMSEDARRVFGNEIFYWAAKLGLLGLAAPDHASMPWFNMIDSVVGMTLYPMINAPDLQRFFSYSRLFTPDQLESSRTTGRVGASADLVRSFNMSDKAGALLYGQRSFTKNLFATVGNAIERQYGKVMFDAMEMCAPQHRGLIYK
jgi:hypothetical protein